MIWHIPGEYQGQMVEVAYGDAYNGKLYRRTTDHSDRSVSYEVADATSCGCESECDCFQPWNSEPAGFRWTPCAAPRE